jgi:hypothetical protein
VWRVGGGADFNADGRYRSSRLRDVTERRLCIAIGGGDRERIVAIPAPPYVEPEGPSRRVPAGFDLDADPLHSGVVM